MGLLTHMVLGSQPEIYEIFVWGFLFLAMAVIIHELGHILVFRFLFKRKVTAEFYWKNWKDFGFETGKDTDYLSVPKKERYQIYVWGVFFGYLPLVAAVLVHPAYWVLWIMYSFGCNADYKFIFDHFEKEHNIR